MNCKTHGGIVGRYFHKHNKKLWGVWRDIAGLHFWQGNFKTNFYWFQWKFRDTTNKQANKTPKTNKQTKSQKCLSFFLISCGNPDSKTLFSKMGRFSTCFSWSCPIWFFQYFILFFFLRIYLYLRARLLLCTVRWDHLTLHKTDNNPTSRYMMSQKYASKLFSRTTCSDKKSWWTYRCSKGTI